MHLIGHQGPTRWGKREKTHPPSLHLDSTALYAIKACQASVTHLLLLSLVPQPSLSISLTFSLSPLHSISFSLSHSQTYHDHHRYQLAPVFVSLHALYEDDEKMLVSGEDSFSAVEMPPTKVVVARENDRGKMALICCLRPLLTVSWPSKVCLDPLIVMVPWVHDESGRIYNHAFRGKLSKLWQLIRVKRDLIFR